MNMVSCIRRLATPMVIAASLSIGAQDGSAQNKRDGEWIGKFTGNNINKCSFGNEATLEPKITSIRVIDSTFTIEVVDNAGPKSLTGNIKADGTVSTHHTVDILHTGPGTGNHTLQLAMRGTFEGNKFSGVFGTDYNKAASCYLDLEMARKDTIEAQALLTGEDPEILRLEAEAANLKSLPSGLPQVPMVAEVDPNRPYDGIWHGIAKSDDQDSCRIESKIKDLTVTDFGYRLNTSTGGHQGRVSASGQISDWITLDIWNANDGDVDSVNVKLDGQFKDSKFDGSISANLAGGNVCTASFKLGPKGSVHAEALLTGKNPRLLALQRRIAAAQDGSAIEKAKQETARLAAQRAEEEKRIATLRAEQEKAREAEETRLAKIRKEQQDELAKLKAEREALKQAEQQRLAAASAERERVRKSEEAELARLKAERDALRKAEENRIAELRAQQKAEEKRLAIIRAEAEQKAQELANLQQAPAATKRVRTKANISFGNYHALVIGINDYKNLTPLRTAVADAEAIADVLSTNYGFKVTKLINPTRDDILDTLDDLRATLKFKDNLLIYYAGHGWLDEEADQGYWLPANAKKDRRSRWVSNATITDTLKAIKSKHVMVVADSCYSGRLVRGLNINVTSKETQDFYKQMSRKKARVVITSGGLEPVEDGKGKHSPFARAFLSALNNNNDVLDGTKLFNTIRRPVMVNANQTPQYSDVRRAGHDGGDFLFVRRN